ncbi:MAG: DNA mismatch repair protein MutS [Bacteroidota bacterium]
MDKQLQQEFESQIEIAQENRKKEQKNYNFFAILRIIFFLLAVVITVYIGDKINIWLGILTGLSLLTAFGFLIKFHQKIAWRKNYFAYLKLVNETEISRLNGNFKEIKDGGDEFLLISHPYALDLDLFGNTSLFKALNRTVTVKGKILLVKWLSERAEKQTILKRQNAVDELKVLSTLRQDFQAKGMFHHGNLEEISKLLKWVHLQASELHQLLPKLLTYLLPTLLLGGTIGYLSLENVPGIAIALPLFLNFLALGKYRKTITALCEDTVKSAKILKTYVALFKVIESNQFRSEYLRETRQQLQLNNELASTAIKKLGRILSYLEVRENVYFYLSVNLFTLYEIHWALQLEEWKEKHKDLLNTWFEALAEFDAIQSVAGFAHINPEFVQPEIAEKSYYYKAENLGHPLIHSEQRVSNDFDLTGKGKIILITGSNMSGKSTFLRTLGVNAVLAFVGAPVCANKLSLSAFDVFTSMRIQDSLEENTSAFYAELKRIKMLFEVLKQEKPVFFLLDEVLKGTNSKDRHLGVNAILRQLFDKTSFGLLSTHDLELNQLADKFPHNIVNKSFNSAIVNQQLHFDYKLHDGMCHSFSASKLMEGLGILGEDTELKI